MSSVFVLPLNNKITDIVLSLQDRSGHYGILPGGSGCSDLDAADILIHQSYLKDYKKRKTEYALIKLAKRILNDQNTDGGFSESKSIPVSLNELLNLNAICFILSNTDRHLINMRARAMLSAVKHKRKEISSQWSDKGLMVQNSNLWDSWFRSLTIAEIDTA